jgi:hypothetical protein
MSSQRSNWRERLHANPSRMETELAINLEHDRINVPVSNHRSICYSLVRLEVVGTPEDPFASLDLAILVWPILCLGSVVEVG